MGLFNKVFSVIFRSDSNNKSQEDIDFENQVKKDGYEYAGKRIADEINKKITSKDLAKQFVLEELDSARQGNKYTQNFVKNSGFKSFEYIGAINKTRWEGDESELEHLQLLLRTFMIRINDVDLMVKVSITVIDEIMQRWSLGKYKNNVINEPISLEDRLNKILLSDEMQSKMYNEARNVKYCADIAVRSQSEKDSIAYQQSIIQAIDSSTEIYEWLKERKVSELNAFILLGSFYLINLSDISFKSPTEFSDSEITNMLESFLFPLGIQGQVDISTYPKLISNFPPSP